jgi:ParB family chromosome partitioning protein|tara:strand:- start:1265 stop:2110 length:846 start_codon:yes stop_codon:yes gene_type:complete
MENRPKKGLGRGLSSLLGDPEKKVTSNKIGIENLVRNKFQPRRHFNAESLLELTNSIKEQGVIQPIVAREDKNNKGKYEIIAGERRWLASQNAGLHEVPVVVLEADDEKSLEIAIVENIQRQDLNAIEEARGYAKLIKDFNYSQEKVSQFIGKSRSYITNSIRLLTLPLDLINMVEAGELSPGHARPLINLNNSLELAKKIIQKKLSVRQTEVLAQQFKDKKFKVISRKDSNILDLQKNLEDKTGLSVSITNKKNNSGTILFEYQDLDQLDKIINVIKNNY